MKNTERFSNRVDNYVKYRPHYPDAVVDCLEENAGLSKNKLVADIGAGTGISSLPFLKRGYHLIAVEPNPEMRAVAEQLKKQFPNYEVKNGTAEETGLEKGSVDLIISGQAFHWFNPSVARKEFQRIARPQAYVALIWNERDISHPFVRTYEELLEKFGTDYKEKGQKIVRSEQIDTFFAGSIYQEFRFENSQYFDFIGLKGRLLSSSYIPVDGPEYEQMLMELKNVFDEFHQEGMVKFNYITRVYLGTI